MLATSDPLPVPEHLLTTAPNAFQCKVCDLPVAEPDSYCDQCIDDFIDRPQLIAMKLLTAGSPPDAVIEELIESGIPDSLAKSIVQATQQSGLSGGNKAIKSVDREAAVKEIFIGILLGSIGGIITYAAFSSAEDGNSSVALVGAIVVGGYKVLKGTLKLLTSYS